MKSKTLFTFLILIFSIIVEPITTPSANAHFLCVVWIFYTETYTNWCCCFFFIRIMSLHRFFLWDFCACYPGNRNIVKKPFVFFSKLWKRLSSLVGVSKRTKLTSLAKQCIHSSSSSSGGGQQ